MQDAFNNPPNRLMQAATRLLDEAGARSRQRQIEMIEAIEARHGAAARAAAIHAANLACVLEPLLSGMCALASMTDDKDARVVDVVWQKTRQSVDEALSHAVQSLVPDELAPKAREQLESSLQTLIETMCNDAADAKRQATRLIRRGG